MKNRQQTMCFTESVHKYIINTVGARPAESGGLLFGSREDFVVRKFVYDKNAKTTRATYTFDIDFLNPMIKKLGEEENLKLLGFLHSHPGLETLSLADRQYFASQFRNFPVDRFLTPIVLSPKDRNSQWDMLCHIFYKDTLDSERVPLTVIPDDAVAPIELNNVQSKDKRPSYPSLPFQKGNIPVKENQGTFNFSGTIHIGNSLALVKQLLETATYLLLFILMTVWLFAILSNLSSF